jgi:hypothetical protein
MFSSRYVKNGDEQTIETISMNLDELLYFLRTIQNVNINLNLFIHIKKLFFF